MTRPVTLVGNDGERLELRGRYRLAINPALWGMPPIAIDTRDMPGVAGTPYRQSRVLARPLRVPIRVTGSTPLECDQAMAHLARLVNPLDGPCRIEVGRADGSARDIEVRYSSGFEAIQLHNNASTQALVDLVVVAHSPFWRSVEEYEYAFEQDAFDVAVTEPLWDAPGPWDEPDPWDGTGAQGVAILPILVNGDVDSWPRFEIVGPGSAVEATNLRTEQTWRYDGVLAAGQKLVVETEPGRRSVRIDDQPALQHLERGAKLWGLKRGTNDVVVRILDYVPGESLFKFTGRDLWLTP